MNEFGGDWTKNKIEILVKYAKAYLTIMNRHPYWKLIYFDGFAGSGIIINENSDDFEYTIGAARRILEINKPKPFDIYYFVEYDPNNISLLSRITRESFPYKNIQIVEEDCNKKLKDLSDFLKTSKGEKYKVLAYIDPCGMQLNWNSLESIKELGIDLWILVPTGMGVNRLLKRNGQISESWLKKLEIFLGLDRLTILNHFYQTIQSETLFGTESKISKDENALNKSANLYKTRLHDIFKFVSDPYVLRNSSNSIMYHLFCATNNQTALKIANDVLKRFITED